MGVTISLGGGWYLSRNPVDELGITKFPFEAATGAQGGRPECGVGLTVDQVVESLAALAGRTVHDARDFWFPPKTPRVPPV